MNNVLLDDQDQIQVHGATVLGFDMEHGSPIIDYGTGPTTLDRARRQGWDNGDERFTDEEVQQINDHLRKHLVH